MTMSEIATIMGHDLSPFSKKPEPKRIDLVEESVKRALADYDYSHRVSEKHPNW